MRVLSVLAICAAGLVLVPAGMSAGSDGSRALDGVYRITWSERELLAAGANPAYVASNFGYLNGKRGAATMKLENGAFRLQEALLPGFLCTGAYTIAGSTVSIRLTKGCFGRITARWSLAGGKLRLRVSQATDPGDAVTFGGKSWRKTA